MVRELFRVGSRIIHYTKKKAFGLLRFVSSSCYGYVNAFDFLHQFLLQTGFGPHVGLVGLCSSVYISATH